MNAETYIRLHVRKILLEQDKKKASVRSVGVGRGRLKFSVKEQGALANDNPTRLMKNLKMSGVKVGKTDSETLGNLLEAAISGTEEMSEVFSGVKKIEPLPRDKGALEGVSVNVGVISPRDGQKYIEYTVLGATNAYKIKWKKDVEVRREGSQINVIFADQKKKKPKKEETNKKENLLGEPDLSKEDERKEDRQEEQSVVANIAGVTTPLGTDSSYPSNSKKVKKRKKKKDDPDEDWYK